MKRKKLIFILASVPVAVIVLGLLGFWVMEHLFVPWVMEHPWP